MRSIACQFCQTSLKAADEPGHVEVCPKFPLPCPNKCKLKEIPRDEYQEHIMTGCNKQLVACPFAAHGCRFKAKKKLVAEHLQENMTDHLTKLNDSVADILRVVEVQTSSVVECQSQVAKVEKRVRGVETLFGASFLWRVDSYAEKVAQAKSGKRTTLFSAPFFSHRYGYRLCITLCPNGDGKSMGKYLSVFVCLCRGDYDALLSWPFGSPITISLLDQNIDPSLRRNIDHVVKPNPCAENKIFLGRPKSERNPCFGASRFCELAELTENYVSDDCIFIRVAVTVDDVSEK